MEPLPAKSEKHKFFFYGSHHNSFKKRKERRSICLKEAPHGKKFLQDQKQAGVWTAQLQETPLHRIRCEYSFGKYETWGAASGLRSALMNP